MVANKGQGDKQCLLCDEEESMLHLGRCPVIRRDFWTYFMDLIGEMGLEKPQEFGQILDDGCNGRGESCVRGGNRHFHYCLEMPLRGDRTRQVRVGTSSFGPRTETSHGNDT